MARSNPRQNTYPPKGGAGWGDTITISGNDFLLEDALVYASGRTAVHTSTNNPQVPYDTAYFNNVSFIAQQPSNWGFRCYGIKDWSWSDCYFYKFGMVKEGHAVYCDSYGNISFYKTLFRENAGQGVQLTFRKANAPSTSPVPQPGVILIDDCKFHHNAYGEDRGAAQIAIYSSGGEQDVTISNSELLCDWPSVGYPPYFYGGNTYHSKGGIQITRTGKKDGSEWWQSNPNQYTQGHIRIENTSVLLNKPDRADVNITGAKTVTIEGCLINGRIDIDHPYYNAKEAYYIQIKNNQGNAIVRHKGQQVGVITDEIIIGSKD